MTDAEFINQVDYEGGLAEAFKVGLGHVDLDPGKLRDIVEGAEEKYEVYSKLEDAYYDFVESCGYEDGE